jgi:cyclase
VGQELGCITPEQQCRVHVAHYILRGPLNLRIWEEKDPRTQEVIAIKQYSSTYEQTRTIWMDGRPHPPPYAPHTWMGFSTGHWEGDRLVVETTHIKQGWHRRNGVPASDLTTMTEHIVLHGEYFTHIAVIRDPVYLSEPMVKSQHFKRNPRALPQDNWLWPCKPVVEIATREEDDVAHYLPGKNPYLEPTRLEAHLPLDGAEGGAASTYPEWLIDRGASSRTDTRIVESAPESVTLPKDEEVHVWPIRNEMYMLASRHGNSTVQVGEDGVLVVDTMPPGMSERLLTAIETITDRPIRYVLNTHLHTDHMGGNVPVSRAGSTRTGGVVVRQIGADIIDTAAILAHENVLTRVSAPTGSEATMPWAAWPNETFFQDHHDFPFNGEGVRVIHMPAAHTDGDTIVFFRRSDVIAAGDVFATTGYPVIDSENGGSIQGIMEAINRLIDLAIPDVDQQGGTMIVPGHGRLSDEMDLVEYRDMLTIITDRVQDMIDRGMPIRQVQAAQPTFDFDARYGAETGPWTTEIFVEAIYNDLRAAKP